MSILIQKGKAKLFRYKFYMQRTSSPHNVQFKRNKLSGHIHAMIFLFNKKISPSYNKIFFDKLDSIFVWDWFVTVNSGFEMITFYKNLPQRNGIKHSYPSIHTSLPPIWIKKRHISQSNVHQLHPRLNQIFKQTRIYILWYNVTYL